MSRIEKQMRKELSDSTPDLKENIKARVNVKTKKSPNYKRAAIPALLMAVVLVVVLTPVFMLTGNDTPQAPVYNKYALSMAVRSSKATTTSDIDISSPSIQITYQNGKVVDVVGLNKAGVILIQSSYNQTEIKKTSIKEALKGQSLTLATEKIIKELNKRGYLTNNELDIVVRDENGNVVNKEYENIKSKFSMINIGLLSEDEIDKLEDELEDNAEKYYEYLKEDIKKYLTAKKEKISELAVGIYEELKNINSNLNKNMFDDFDEIEEMFEDEDIFNNQTIINLIKQYPYNKDILEDYNLENLSGEDFVEIYEEILEDFEDIIDQYTDIIHNRIPDDVDDIFEDLYFKKAN